MEQLIITKEASFERLRTWNIGGSLYLVAQNIPTSAYCLFDTSLLIDSLYYVFGCNIGMYRKVALVAGYASFSYPLSYISTSIHRRSIKIVKCLSYCLSYRICWLLIIIGLCFYCHILWISSHPTRPSFHAWNMWNLLHLLRRCIVVAADQCCEICGADAMSERFYAFTCTHCCHEACLRPSDL